MRPRSFLQLEPGRSPDICLRTSYDARDEWPGELGGETFAEFVADLAEKRWGRVWEVDVSPPSPAEEVDVRLATESDRRLVRFRQIGSGSVVGTPEVRALADLRDDLNLERVVFVATGEFSGSARSVARERTVGLVGPERLVSWAREAGVRVPSPTVDSESLPDRTLERYAAYWPDPLAERVGDVLDALDELADFEYEVNEGDASTELRCHVDDGPAPVLARFGETNFLVYVSVDGEYDSVVRLTAYRTHQPPTSELRPDLERAIRRAIE
jgi:hypothetical protein